MCSLKRGCTMASGVEYLNGPGEIEIQHASDGTIGRGDTKEDRGDAGLPRRYKGAVQHIAMED